MFITHVRSLLSTSIVVDHSAVSRSSRGWNVHERLPGASAGRLGPAGRGGPGAPASRRRWSVRTTRQSGGASLYVYQTDREGYYSV